VVFWEGLNFFILISIIFYFSLSSAIPSSNLGYLTLIVSYFDALYLESKDYLSAICKLRLGSENNKTAQLVLKYAETKPINSTNSDILYRNNQ